jgi:YVTN family beta-propeller protein
MRRRLFRKALLPGLAVLLTVLTMLAIVSAVLYGRIDLEAFAHTYTHPNGNATHLHIDADVTNGSRPCDPMDQTTTAEVGATHKVGVCIEDYEPNSIQAFELHIRYTGDPDVVPPTIINKATEVQDITHALDDNPDANDGDDPAGFKLGGGWDCTGFGVKSPVGEDPATPGVADAFIVCNGDVVTPDQDLSADPGLLATIEFTAQEAGADTIDFGPIQPSISVIDGGTNTVMATVPVGLGPQGVAVNPGTNRIYVANYYSDNVSVIHGGTNTVVATIPVGLYPDGVAVNPGTNRVYVTNFYSDDVSVIDGGTNTVVATVPVGLAPQGVAVDPGTNRVYVANHYSANVSVIDGGTNAVVATVPVGSEPRRVAVNPATNRIYATKGDSVSVIDGGTNTVVATIPVDAGGVAVNPATNRVYVVNSGSQNVSVIDGGTNTVVATVPVGYVPSGVAVNSHTNRIYVANYGDANVSVIDGSTNSIMATVRVGSPGGVAVNSSTNRIYVGNSNPNSNGVRMKKPGLDELANCGAYLPEEQVGCFGATITKVRSDKQFDCLFEDDAGRRTSLSLIGDDWEFSFPGGSVHGTGGVRHFRDRAVVRGQAPGFIVVAFGTCPSGPALAVALDMSTVPFLVLRVADHG